MCRSGLRALVLALALAACAAHVVAARAAAAEQLIAQGALSYTFYCAACHGGNGAGSPAAHAPELAGREAGSLVRQISALRDAARAGRAGRDNSAATGKHARVLAQLSSEQIEAIAEYLASLAPPPSAAD